MKRNVIDIFWEEATRQAAQHQNDRMEISPIIITSKHYFISTHRFSLTFVTAETTETNPLLVMELHHIIIEVFQEYFGDPLNETILRENFSIAYQLLDEMIDGGFPAITEINQLKDLIHPPSLARRVYQNVTGEFALKQDFPSGAMSKIPWRKADVRYVTNEIYFDIVEQIDCILGPNSQVISANVYGEIKTTCRLSGMPDLTLSFTKPSLLDDVALHRCVRINRYQREKVISFVPPDGQFKLLSYRIGGAIQMPIYVKPMITYKNGNGKVTIMVGPKYTQDKPINGVVIIIPFPSCLKSANLTPNHGSIKIDQNQVCRWDIGRMPKEKTPMLEGSITLPADFPNDELPIIRAEFNVKMFACSGLKVDGLAIRGVSYKPFKGVRSLTQAGRFQVRCVE